MDESIKPSPVSGETPTPGRVCPHCNGSLNRYEDPEAVKIIGRLEHELAESKTQCGHQHQLLRSVFYAAEFYKHDNGYRLNKLMSCSDSGKEVILELDERDKLQAELATERAAREKREANPAVGTCVFCGSTIWHNEHQMIDERGMFHPICGVKARAEAAEARAGDVAKLREALDQTRGASSIRPCEAGFASIIQTALRIAISAHARKSQPVNERLKPAVWIQLAALAIRNTVNLNGGQNVVGQTELSEIIKTHFSAAESAAPGEMGWNDDASRLSEIDERKWCLLFNGTIHHWTVQEYQQVVGCISQGRTAREAIDKAIVAARKTEGAK